MRELPFTATHTCAVARLALQARLGVISPARFKGSARLCWRSVPELQGEIQFINFLLERRRITHESRDAKYGYIKGSAVGKITYPPKTRDCVAFNLRLRPSC